MPTPNSIRQITSSGALTSIIDSIADQQGAALVSELHGRLYQLAYQGRLYSGGMTLTSINNATFTTATLGATGTPIVGVWNPSTSGVNLEIIQASLTVAITAATATGPGGFAWCSSVGNTAALSAGLTPWNRKTLAQSGSASKNLAGVAMTGLAVTTVVMHGSALSGGAMENYSFVGTAAGAQTGQATSVENFDGSLIVPPGGVLALLCTTTPVAHSAASQLIWAESPV